MAVYPPRPVPQFFVASTTIVAVPSDARDGRDRFGFALATASWTAATLQLTQAGAFASYTPVAGDCIYLSHASITDGLYEIASKINDDTIVLAESISGSNQVNVASSDGPWLTLQFAVDTMATAGSVLNICADGTWSPTARIDFDTNPGTREEPLTFRGTTARGVWDGATRATIDGGSLPVSTSLFLLDVAELFCSMTDLNLTGGKLHNIQTGTVNNCSCWMSRCEISGAATDGIFCDDANVSFVLIDCDLVSNGNDGAGGGTGSEGNYFLDSCSVHDNVRYGVKAANYHTNRAPCGTIINSLIYDNGDDGVRQAQGSGGNFLFLENNTFERNGGSGLMAETGVGPNVVRNNVFANNSRYGIELQTTSELTKLVEIRANHFSGNGLGATNLAETPDPFGDNTSGDPRFVSVVDGAEDYTPRSSSPLVNAGVGAPSS